MSYFKSLPYDSDNEEMKALLQEVKEKLNSPIIPTFMSTLANYSEEALKASWGLNTNLMLSGKLPRMLKEMIFVAVSNQRNCEYCKTTHMAFCQFLGIDDEMAEYLTKDIRRIEPDRIRVIMQFALKCALNAKSVGQQDFIELKEHNVNDSEIVEIVTVTAVAVYHNIISDVLQLRPEQEFANS